VPTSPSPFPCSSLTCRRSISAPPSRRFFHQAPPRSSHSRQLRHQASRCVAVATNPRSRDTMENGVLGTDSASATSQRRHRSTPRDYTDSAPASSYSATSEPWPEAAAHQAAARLPRRASASPCRSAPPSPGRIESLVASCFDPQPRRRAPSAPPPPRLHRAAAPRRLYVFGVTSPSSRRALRRTGARSTASASSCCSSPGSRARPWWRAPSRRV
jgi:hypothetical protein